MTTNKQIFFICLYSILYHIFQFKLEQLVLNHGLLIRLLVQIILPTFLPSCSTLLLIKLMENINITFEDVILFFFSIKLKKIKVNLITMKILFGECIISKDSVSIIRKYSD